MKHIFLVGACYLDTILRHVHTTTNVIHHSCPFCQTSYYHLIVPHYPEEDSKLRATSLTIRRGGNCPNSLHVLAQILFANPAAVNDLSPHLISCLPDPSSPATSKIRASFAGGSGHDGGNEGEGGGVDLSRCIHRPGVEEAASSFIIRSAQTGSRTIVNYNGLDEMTVDEFRGVVEGACSKGEESWWHFEGRIPDTILQCIHHLRRVLPNATISVEVEKPEREGLIELANSADVVFYSRSWAENRGHGSATACLEKETPPTASLALCTWGARGAAAYVPAARETVECPVETPSGQDIDVVDTIGAGDTFIAAILYGLSCHSADWDTRAKLRFAVDLATLKVQREGFEGLGRDAQGQL